MKICITSDGNNLESNVDPRFGRCAYFIIYDTETDNYQIIPNENAQGVGGVGIKNATMIAEKGVELIITGNIGPNASRVFNEFGIKVITGVNGKIKEVIDNFKKGNIK